MKTLSRSVAFTALILALSFSATAQQRNNMGMRPNGKMGQMQPCQAKQGTQHQRMMGMLNLTDDQQEQIQTIHLNGQKAMLPMRTQIQEKNAQLLTLTLSDDYDEADAKNLINEIADLHTAMLTMRISHQQQIRNLLTDEQRVKFDTFHLNMKNRMGRMGPNR